VLSVEILRQPSSWFCPRWLQVLPLWLPSTAGWRTPSGREVFLQSRRCHCKRETGNC
jgi:hypothetical protein